jgi:antirestriction protein ArdC
MQRPDATHVAGFHRWKELGRFVKKGEKGITILAPLVRKARATDEIGRRDSQPEATDEEAQRVICGFRSVHVFDVSQTEGQELPEFSRIDGNPGDKLARLEAVVRNHSIELEYDAIPGGADGVSQGGRIVVTTGLQAAEQFAVLAHELAHELLHRTERRKETTRKVRELEAEAVAFVVSRAAGLEAISRSADYIQLYAGDKDLLLQSLDHIQRVASGIIEALEAEDAGMAPAGHSMNPQAMAASA